MISLLLTLFISMLSIGSPINKLEENSESRISTISNESFNLYGSTNKKSSIDYNGMTYGIAFTDLFNADIFNRLITFDRSINGEFVNGVARYYQFSDNEPCFFAKITDIPRDGDTPLAWTTSLGNVTNYGLVRNYSSLGYYYYEFTLYSNNKYAQFYFYQYLPYDNYSGSIVAINNNNSTTLGTNKDNLAIIYSRYSSFYSIFADPQTNEWFDGYSQGLEDGKQVGYNEGYQTGYNQGLNNVDYDNTALTIFTGITSIALVPINMFLNIFNFEILGINLSGFISGILTVAVVVIIIRMITGGKKDD